MCIVCNAGLCFFLIFLYCGELTQCGLFFIFWSNEEVWDPYMLLANKLRTVVHLFLAMSLLIRTLKCSGTGLGSGGRRETVMQSGLGLVGCPNFAHSFCQSSSHCFCSFSKLHTIV